MEITFRPITATDNPIIAELIRNVFREFNIDRPGTVYTDPTTDHLFELFQTERSCYWIAEENGKIAGGCGLYPTEGLPEGCVEMVKLYLSKEARGKGIGKQLMEICFDVAKKMNYHQIYLESLPELSKAISMYEKNGFRMICSPLGNTGHHGCSVYAIKEL